MATSRGAPTGVITLVAPPERHIPIDYPEIYHSLKAVVPSSQQDAADEVSKLMEALVNLQALQIRRRLRNNFLPFSAGAKETVPIVRVDKELPSSESLDKDELRFVADWVDLMTAAHYELLTQIQWKIATSDDFAFDMPMKIMWQKLDTKLLEGFWGSTPLRTEQRANLFSKSDRILVFHRGVGVMTRSDLFVMQKVDLLVEYLVVQPLYWLLRQLHLMKPLKMLTLPEQSDHKHRKLVERKTLRRLMPTVWTVLKNLPRKLEIQEPSFKNVVVLYREVVPAKVIEAATDKELPAGDRAKAVLRARNIYIKQFCDIAMADVEVTLPDKKIYIKPLAIIQLAASLITGILAAVTLLRRGNINPTIIWTAFSLFGARCSQVYTGMVTQQANLLLEMGKMLYAKTEDGQDGVVSRLVEDMQDQEVKQLVLAYNLLLAKSGSMGLTVAELDDVVEEYLSTTFNLPLDFSIENTLPRLLHWGVILRVGDRFVAKPYEQARAQLEQVWIGAYKSAGKVDYTESIAAMLVPQPLELGSAATAALEEKVAESGEPTLAAPQGVAPAAAAAPLSPVQISPSTPTAASVPSPDVAPRVSTITKLINRARGISPAESSKAASRTSGAGDQGAAAVESRKGL